MSYESIANHRQIISEARDALAKGEIAYCFNPDQLEDIKALGFDINVTDNDWYYTITLKGGD